MIIKVTAIEGREVQLPGPATRHPAKLCVVERGRTRKRYERICHCQVLLAGSHAAVWFMHRLGPATQCPGIEWHISSSEQQQDIQDKEWLIMWIEPPWNTSMVHAAPGGHVVIFGP